MKKLLTVILTLVMVGIFLATSCSAPAPAPAPAPSPSPSPAPAPAPTTFELKAATPFPEGQTDAEMLIWYADQVNKRTNGRVKVNIFFAGALGGGTEIPQNLDQGIADLALTAPPYTTSRFPIFARLATVPFRIKSPMTTAHIYNTVYAMGYADAEMQGLKLLWVQAVAPLTALLTRKVNTLEDVKGMKLRTSGASAALLIEALGGVPTSLPPGDLYNALDRGIVEGTIGGRSLIVSGKLYEVAKFHLMEQFSGAVLFGIMNKSKWDSLPPDLQLILDKLNEDTLWYAMNAKSIFLQGVSKDIQANGVEEYTLAPAELERWKNASSGVFDSIIKEINDLNLPGDDIKTVVNNALWHWEQ